MHQRRHRPLTQQAYLDSSTEPLVCETDDGGSIDGHPFTTSDGRRYLYWKNDGNRIGVDTWISVQRLDASGTKLVGKPQRLIKQDQPWEGSLLEAPFVVEADGTSCEVKVTAGEVSVTPPTTSYPVAGSTCSAVSCAASSAARSPT